MLNRTIHSNTRKNTSPFYAEPVEVHPPFLRLRLSKRLTGPNIAIVSRAQEAELNYLAYTDAQQDIEAAKKAMPQPTFIFKPKYHPHIALVLAVHDPHYEDPRQYERSAL